MYTPLVQQNIIYCKKQRNNFMQMQIPRKTNNNAIELMMVDEAQIFLIGMRGCFEITKIFCFIHPLDWRLFFLGNKILWYFTDDDSIN